MCLGSNDSQINPHMRAKFGRGLTVVLKKRGVQSLQTDTHRQRDAAALYLVE